MPDDPCESTAASQEPTRFARWLESIVPAVYESDAELARALGTSQANISRWRKGTTPQVPALLKLSRLTGTSVDVLLRIAGYQAGGNAS